VDNQSNKDVDGGIILKFSKEEVIGLEFKVLKKAEVIDDIHTRQQIDNIWSKYAYLQHVDFYREVNIYMPDDDYFICSFSGEEMMGFAAITLDARNKRGDLLWFVVDKENAKGFSNKSLLDKVIEFCRTKGMKTLSWTCLDASWRNVNNKEKIFKRFGYNPTVYDDGDMELNLE